MSADLLEHRVLGALRFTDAVTGLPIDTPLTLTAPGVRWIRNRRACWVIASAPGLEEHENAFVAAAATPAIGSVPVLFTVRDPAGRWLSRVGSIALPRDPDPAHAAAADSLFAVRDVPLFPAPAAPTQRGWAVVRGSVRSATPGATLPGALVRVVRESDGVRIGAGMSDDRGEAMVAVEGIPSSSLGDGDGPVVATEVAVRLEVVWDANAGAVPDPDALEARHDALFVRQATTRLASGRLLTMTL